MVYLELDLDALAENFLSLSERRNLLASLVENIKERQIKTTLLPDLRGKLALPPYTEEDQIFVSSKEDLPTYNLERNRISAEVQAISKMLRIYLMSRSKRSWSRNLEEGRLDIQRLASLATKTNSRIFKERKEVLAIETAVELLIDLSSSMREDITRSSAICLAESLSSIPKLKLEITGFNAIYNRNGKNNRAEFRDLGRITPLHMPIFKDFNETYSSARGKLGAIRTLDLTPLGCAYGKGLERLLSRNESRRILWLVTDGQPEFAQGSRLHSDFIVMKNVQAKAKRLGIETVALGIGQDFVKDYVDHFFFINDIRELPLSLMNIIKQLHP